MGEVSKEAELVVVFVVLMLLFIASVWKWWSTRNNARHKSIPETNRELLRALRLVIAACLVFGVLIFCLGVGGAEFPFWRADWLKAWAHSASDWILVWQALLVGLVALLVFVLGPETAFTPMMRTHRLKVAESRRHLSLSMTGMDPQEASEILGCMGKYARRPGPEELDLVRSVVDGVDLSELLGDGWRRRPFLQRRRWKKLRSDIRHDLKLEEPPLQFDRPSFGDAARHEVGHAVVGKAVGGDVYWVEVDAPGRGSTGARDYYSEHYGVEVWAHQRWADLVSLLAGEICEDMEKVGVFSQGTRSDWGKALDAAFYLHTCRATIDGMLPGSVASWIQAAADEARRILVKNASTVKLLIHRLESGKDEKSYSGIGMNELRELLADVPLEGFSRISTHDIEVHRRRDPLRNLQRVQPEE